jgi:hypothetical protein
MTEAQRREIDEALLVLLRMQPSEIDALDLEDYEFWATAATREAGRQTDRMKLFTRLFG